MKSVESPSHPAVVRDKEFWRTFPEIAWSNREADDSTCIRAALMRPRFECLLAIARRFGLEKLQAEWMALLEDELSDTSLPAPHVERILRNIAIGFEDARS